MNAPAIRDIDTLLAAMWADYTAMNPKASRIFELFRARGETVVNDHIALRTFDHPSIGIDVLARPFLDSGYRERGDYTFPEKKLVARHYEPTSGDRPKIFISELRVAQLDAEAQSILGGLIDQVGASTAARFDLCVSGRPWKLDHASYARLRAQSEYAAWVAAFGFRPNHFTVLVNALETLPSLEEVNAFLEAEGFLLNEAGGKIKGNPEARLEQSSVLANNIDVAFEDGIHTIPGCYYEFAKRYPLPDGMLYEGFIAASADKIFESTDRGQ